MEVTDNTKTLANAIERIAELEAHCAHLFNAACDNCYWEQIDGHGTVHTEIPEWLDNFSKGEKYETPKQSLAHIQREAIENAVNYVVAIEQKETKHQVWTIAVGTLRKYAEQLTKESDK